MDEEILKTRSSRLSRQSLNALQILETIERREVGAGVSNRQPSKRHRDLGTNLEDNLPRLKKRRTGSIPSTLDYKVEGGKTLPEPLRDPSEPRFDNIINAHPRYPCPASIQASVSNWLEGICPDYRDRPTRPTRALSDSCLYYSREAITDKVLKPGMGDILDASELSANCDTSVDFTAPSQSGASWGPDIEASLGITRSSRQPLVERMDYRSTNLEENNIYMRHAGEAFPSHIADLVNEISKGRSSPGPSLDEVRQSATLQELEDSAKETEVEVYFKSDLFNLHKPESEFLQRSDRLPMANSAIPRRKGARPVSKPIPDMLYGYRTLAFSEKHTQHPHPEIPLPKGILPPANSTNRLVYPFFAIDFKGEDGSLYVATNQCLGSSSSCVKLAETLNCQLSKCIKTNPEVNLINSAAFSLAMNGTEARLFVSWKHNERDYYMRKVRTFAVQEPDQYLEFYKYVRNIVDWGMNKRLLSICTAWDILLLESRKRAAESHTSTIGSGKRRK
ncbi:hypothetical protein F5Y10DRAFT_269245 [Nemania abortiva]|nr:hypothetical protein F5Y10DRAFT_269245 [Nemania abortiva]